MIKSKVLKRAKSYLSKKELDELVKCEEKIENGSNMTQE